MIPEQEARNYRRLWRKPKPHSQPVSTAPAPYPKAVCELSGGDLGYRTPKVVWEQKHGVWFFTRWELPLRGLDYWGFGTWRAFASACHKLNYAIRWLSQPISDSVLCQPEPCPRVQE